MFRPDVCAAAVKSNKAGTAHFDDVELLHILDECIDLLAVTGSLNADCFICEVNYLRAEYVCSFNDVSMLLFGVPDLYEKKFSLDTFFCRKNDDFLNVVEFTELGYNLILLVFLCT